MLSTSNGGESVISNTEITGGSKGVGVRDSSLCELRYGFLRSSKILFLTVTVPYPQKLNEI